jgi:ABC-type long-subunit fatty acid transport system fused permease/ATPase subunit
MEIMLILVLAYFLPVIVAMSRKVKNRSAIGVLNLFLGWTLVGWVVALMMAVKDKE